MECSHGWSEGRCRATAAQPVEGNSPEHPCPGGAAESPSTRPTPVYASPMRPHPRIRKVVKWGGLALAIALVVAVAMSRTTYHSAEHHSVRSVHSLTVTAGTLNYTTITTPPLQPNLFDTIVWSKLPLPVPQLHWWFDWTRTRTYTFVCIPLWPPALVCFAASALAWRLDTLTTRRERHGACPSCGYDRSGLALPAPCPECGTAT